MASVGVALLPYIHAPFRPGVSGSFMPIRAGM